MSMGQTSSELAIANLPIGWKLVRLKSIADIRYGLGQPPPEKDGGVFMIRATDIDAGKIIEGNFLSIDPDSLPIERDPYLKEGEIIVVRRGAYTGDSAIIPAKLAGAVAGYDMVVTVKKAAPEFVGYCLLSGYVVEDQLSLLTLRAAQPHLNAQELGGIQIPLPPRSEQPRIAAYLDASCAAIDAAVDAKRRQLETLDALRGSIISRAVTYGIAAQHTIRQVEQDWLRELPSHWEICRLKRVLARMDYGISESTNEEGRFPVLKMGHLSDGEISFSKLDFVDEVSEDLLLETGDLLYNRTNSPDRVGKAAIFRKSKSDEVTFASYLVRLRVNHRANPYFLNYVLNSGGFLGFARRLAIPSVQQSNLNSTRYSRLFIPLPPIEEQEAICDYLDAKLDEVKRIVASIEAQIATLTAYRKSLIHECVTGQRQVTEADMRRMGAREAAATA